MATEPPPAVDIAAREADLRRRLAADLGDAAAWGELAALGLATGRHAAAIALVRHAVALAPDSTAAWFTLGTAATAAGQEAAALGALDHAAALSPQTPEIWNNLGGVHQNAGRIDPAIAAFDRALALRPRYPEVQRNLAQMLRFKSLPREAIRHHLAGLGQSRGPAAIDPDHRRQAAELLARPLPPGPAPAPPPVDPGRIAPPDGIWFAVTYRRPHHMQRLLDAAADTGMSTPGLVVVHGDPDPAYDALRLPANWRLHRLPTNGGGLAPALAWAEGAHPGRAWYGLLTDDHLPQTAGWDRALVETAGSRRIASADDLWQSPGRIHGAWVWGGDLARAIGPAALTLPGLTHTFLDDYWETVGAELGVWTCRRDVVTEHLHVSRGKAAYDASYASAYVGHEASRQVFLDWRRRVWPGLRARLAAAGFDALGDGRRPPDDPAIVQLFDTAAARFLETWIDEAVRLLLILLARCPDHPGANAALAAALAYDGQDGLAAGFAARARALGPADPDVVEVLG